MRYHDPSTVLSPRDMVSNVRVIFDGGNNSFSLATIEWDGTDCLAMRWNIALREWDDPEKINNNRICVGMPSSRGYPVWFILPDSSDKKYNKLIEILAKNLK